MSHFVVTPTFRELTQGFDFSKQIMHVVSENPSVFIDVKEHGHDVKTSVLYHEKEEWIYPLDYFEGNPTQSVNYLAPTQRVERPGERAEKFLISIGALTLGLVILDGYLGGAILSL